MLAANVLECFGSAVGVREAELLTSVPAEIELGDVTLKMLLADTMADKGFMR